MTRRKTLASIVLAAGISAFGQTYTFDHFDAGRGEYFYVDSNGNYLTVDKSQYTGQKNITFSQSDTSKSGPLPWNIEDSMSFLSNYYAKDFASNEPHYDSAISNINEVFEEFDLKNSRDYKKLDLGTKLLGLLGTAYNKTGQQQKTIDEILPVLGSIDSIVFPKDPSAVIAGYSAVAEVYYSLAQKEVKGSEKQMSIYKKGANIFDAVYSKFGEKFIDSLARNDWYFLENLTTFWYNTGERKLAKNTMEKLTELYPDSEAYKNYYKEYF